MTDRGYHEEDHDRPLVQVRMRLSRPIDPLDIHMEHPGLLDRIVGSTEALVDRMLRRSPVSRPPEDKA